MFMSVGESEKERDRERQRDREREREREREGMNLKVGVLEEQTANGLSILDQSIGKLESWLVKKMLRFKKEQVALSYQDKFTIKKSINLTMASKEVNERERRVCV